MRFGPERWSPLALLLLGGACLAPTLAAPRRTPAAAPVKPTGRPAERADYVRDVKPLTQKYCGGCHSKTNALGGLDLSIFADEASVIKGRNQWEHISRRIADKEMPPKNAAQPTPAERALLNTWIDSKLSTMDCKVKEPGRVTMRRLNRAEYNNTIRDLVGVDFKPADDFPSDDVGYGFDNIGDVLSISPLLMEKYLNAAEKVSRAAIVMPTPIKVEKLNTVAFAGSGAVGVLNKTSSQFTGKGELHSGITIPAEDDYIIRVRAYQKPAGQEAAKLQLQWGGSPQRGIAPEPIATLEVNATSAKVFEVPVKLKAARKQIQLLFANPLADPSNPAATLPDRALVIESLELVGPMHPPQKPKTLFQQQVLAQQPASPTEWRATAKKALAPFLKRAWRRPVSDEEVDRVARYVELAQKQGDGYDRGMQLALQAALVSPNFLFHVETNRQPVNAASPGYLLNDWELASRLSYFLWSSMPDETLFRLAETGMLKKPEVLKAQALRMLRDPKAHALVENFGDQWLNLRLLRNVNPDPKRFPNWDESLRSAMLQETELFFQSVMSQNRPVTDFLDAKYTYLNERLAKHYGIPGVTGNEFREVALTDGRRGGLITQASILTITSNPTRTSPVKRGKWVLEQILGTPPPPPPPNVPELKAEGGMAGGTLRQRMEQHRKDPACATCHLKMDALGFGMENYDAVGAWRDKDGDAAVDSSGTLPGGKSFAGPAELKTILKGQKDAFAVAFARQLTTFALGRGLEYYDRCTVDDICRKTGATGYHFGDLVGEIVSSVPFRMRKGEQVVRN